MTLSYTDASIQDLPEIVDIYNSTIASRMVTADTELVSVASKEKWFYDHNPIDRPLWIIRNENMDLIGWVSFQSFYGRPAYQKTAEISIYLASSQRGKGYGKRVLRDCLEKAPALNIHTILAYIFGHNTPSLSLFQGFGFEEWANLKDIAELDGVKRSLIILGKHLDDSCN